MDSHSHARSVDAPDLVLRPAVRRWLTGTVVALVLSAVVGVIATWPAHVPSASTAYVDSSVVHARITSTAMHTCSGGQAEDLLPDGTMPATVACPDAAVVVDGGVTTTVRVPVAVFHGGLAAGDRVTLTHYPASVAGAETYVWQDFDRRMPLAVVCAAFVLFTVFVGRRRGLAALAGLILGGVGVAYYVLPALLAQENAVVVGLSAATAVMSVVIYLTHGVSTRTTVAFLGTVAGLVVTAVVAVLAVDANHLRGLSDESSYTVTVLTGAVDLRGVVLAGTLVAALGILNDVTITQAAAVWEVRAADLGAGFRTLFTAGMRVGRDHLASTVYTVTFAYAGAALPSLLLVRLYGQPLRQLVSTSAIAEELVRTAVGGIALAITVPTTTAVAAALVSRSGAHQPPATAAGHETPESI